MKLLFCCDNYWPSRGGVQEVIRQIAERMAAAGHDVSVATRVHPDRTTDVYNGVRIVPFNVSGNLVSGMRGEVDRYRKFLTDFDGDAILIKAAQQWSFDALWPVLDRIKARKIFVPCGFSGLYEPRFKNYFREMPNILRKFDHLIFYAESYRDVDFARANALTKFSIVPNGASEHEFGRTTRQDGRLREELGIPVTDLVFLSVGSPTHAKGHEFVAEAFTRADLGDRGATLILNGDWPSKRFGSKRIGEVLRSFRSPAMIREGLQLLRERGLITLFSRLFPGSAEPRTLITEGSAPGESEMSGGRIAAVAKKTILRLNLPREKVVDAFFETDLFIFASKVEYSPLVLFEAAAAGTPFLTVPVGNADEIVRWTGGGWLCPAHKDERGDTTVSPDVLAREIEEGVHSPDYLRKLGEAGRRAWYEHFTWDKIAKSYERILEGETIVSVMPSKTTKGVVR